MSCARRFDDELVLTRLELLKISAASSSDGHDRRSFSWRWVLCASLDKQDLDRCFGRQLGKRHHPYFEVGRMQFDVARCDVTGTRIDLELDPRARPLVLG